MLLAAAEIGEMQHPASPRNLSAYRLRPAAHSEFHNNRCISPETYRAEITSLLKNIAVINSRSGGNPRVIVTPSGERSAHSAN